MKKVVYMKRKILITSPKKLSETTSMIIAEAEKLFRVNYVPLNEITIRISEKGIEVLHNKRNIGDVDYFLPRIDGKRLYYGYKVVSAFDVIDVRRPYPASTLLVAHDKFLSTLVLKKHGLPVPETYTIKSLKSLELLKNKLKFPLMVKLLSGSGGKGVMFIENEEQMMSVCKSMEELNQELIIQEFVENCGEDLRLLVLGNSIAAAMKRIAPEGEKRANISGGGKAIPYEPTDDVKEIALKTAEVLNAKILAVDIIIGKDNKARILEINVNPGIRGLMKATDKNIAKMIVEYVHEEVMKEEKC
jgi:ribosomal protein S6--L-glutamate ligase